MVSIERIMMNNCRLCHDKPGQHNINTDKKLIKEIYDCLKIRVNDKSMVLLPKCICEECNKTIKNFFLYKQHIQKVDKSLRKLILNSESTDNNPQNSSLEGITQCTDYPGNIFKNHLKKTISPRNLYSFQNKKDCVDGTEKKLNYIECNESFSAIQEHKPYTFQQDVHLRASQNNEDDLLNVKSEKDDSAILVENKSHMLKQESNLNEEQSKCDSYEQKCNTPEELQIHKKDHRSKYVCSWKNCKKILTSAYTLKTHELKHTGKRPFLCVTCGKGFITKNSLTCHEKIHLDVKGYICKLCDIGFSVRSNLRAHEKKYHEGIRFYCSQCTKVFVSKCSLERHERIHTGVKEFQCETCPSAFYTNKELVKHQRYHQGLRLHKCNECFKTFFERHHLVIHLRSHTGERPYVCKVPNCGKSFMESQKLKRHQKAKHAQL